MEKRFNLFLTEEMHREIKIKATLENKSMNDLIVEAIKKQMKDEPQTSSK